MQNRPRGNPTPEEIKDAWTAAATQFENKSIEFVAAIVADRLRIESSRVFDALATGR